MTHDPVNHPSHYTDGGIETIDFIEAKQLPYHLGNAVKYISRAGKIQDLKKAVWYINRLLLSILRQGYGERRSESACYMGSGSDAVRAALSGLRRQAHDLLKRVARFSGALLQTGGNESIYKTT